MNGSVRVNGRVPRYHRIHEGELRPGARLDNQRRLAKSFGVTLMTLRQALELLEREHLISRRHGLGTFVAAPSIDYDILQLRRFAGDLQAKGEQVTTRLVGTKFALADHRVSDALGLGPGARVLVLERLRLVDGHPMSLQRSFLPAPIGEEVVRADLARTPLHRALEVRLGLVVESARETVSAFESERVSYAAGGAPVVFDRVFIPGDRFRITRELHYESLQGATS